VKKLLKKYRVVSSGIVGGVLNDTYKKIVPTLNQGTEKVYEEVYSQVKAATKSISAGHLAGAAAQEATIPQLKKLQDEIPN
jgi:hypothetical protein